MANLLTLTTAFPSRSLKPREMLVEAGAPGGELYVLAKGRLSVIRDGVEIAQIEGAGALVGEMSVLLGTDYTATVTAITPVEVKVIEDGIGWLERTPIAALHVATVACQRLDNTSALLAELRREGSKPHEPGFFERLFGAVSGESRPAPHL
jgi:CRP/FNR family cyclic AMP-dependent transcriptional regulator